ncbi:hypothetical protein RUND412_009079 [Rhizina undulata]
MTSSWGRRFLADAELVEAKEIPNFTLNEILDWFRLSSKEGGQEGVVGIESSLPQLTIATLRMKHCWKRYRVILRRVRGSKNYAYIIEVGGFEKTPIKAMNGVITFDLSRAICEGKVEITLAQLLEVSPRLRTEITTLLRSSVSRLRKGKVPMAKAAVIEDPSKNTIVQAYGDDGEAEVMYISAVVEGAEVDHILIDGGVDGKRRHVKGVSILRKNVSVVPEEDREILITKDLEAEEAVDLLLNELENWDCEEDVDGEKGKERKEEETVSGKVGIKIVNKCKVGMIENVEVKGFSAVGNTTQEEESFSKKFYLSSSNIQYG